MWFSAYAKPRTRALPSAVLLLAACTGADPGKPGGRDSADTGARADTADPADTGDTAAPGDTGDSTESAPDANVGDLSPTFAFDTERDYPTIAAVEDLDGDGIDELVLVWSWGGAAVLRPDLATASARMTWLAGEYREVWAAGNGQLLVEDDSGYAAIRLADGPDGWVVSERLGVGTTWCASPAGDLDGDGTSDVLVQGGSEVLRVVRGPVGDGYEVIAELQGWSQRSVLQCGGSTGDVDGDGADDLLWVESDDDSLRVAFGPVRAGQHSIDSFPDLQLDVGQSLGDARALVSPDLDGDGTSEVVVLSSVEVLGFDGLDRTTRSVAPEWTIEQAGHWGVSRRGEGMLLFSAREAAWWREAPTSGASRPPAAGEIPYYNAVVAGRFGSGSGLDLAWVSNSSVYFVPGAGARGADVDRDGSAAPEDCDDAESAVRAAAPELPDGSDNDCDGAVDESAAVELSLLVAHPGDRNAFLGAAGLVAWPHSGAARVVFTTELSERAWVATLLVGDAEPLSASGRVDALANAGDVDGDGLADLAVLLGGSAQAEVVYGPAPGASPAAIDLPLDEAWSLAPVGDLDGDGQADLLAGGGYYDPDADWAFVQRLAFVPGNGLTGQAVDGMGAPDAVGPVDLNDDGYDDLLLAEGDASFWFGPIASSTDLAAGTASGELTGVPTLLYAGDLDADGVSDLLGASDDGVVVAHGPWSEGSWDFDAEVDARRLSGPVSALAWGTDWLFATTSSEDWQAQVLGFGLPLAGEATADDAELRVLSNQPRARTGSGLVVADLDGDGVEELVVASPGEAAPADDEGVLRVYGLP